MSDLRVVIAGVGAAGVAIAKILMEAGVPDGSWVPTARVPSTRVATTSTSAKQWFAENTNPDRVTGGLDRVHAGRRRVHRGERART